MDRNRTIEIVVFFCIPLAASLRICGASELMACDEVRHSDPNSQVLTDMRLKSLYTEAVQTTRCMVTEHVPQITWEMVEDGLSPEQREALDAYESRRQAKIEAYIAKPRPSEEVDYIIAAAQEALNVDPPDWNTYRVALWVAKVGMREDPRLVPLARQALDSPRGEKISDSHGLALLDALSMLGLNNSQDAIDILLEATQPEFWKRYPVRSTSIDTYVVRAIDHMRHRAMLHLTEAPAALSVPALLRLVEKVPDMAIPAPAPPPNSSFEESLRYRVQKALKEIDERGGGPAPARF